MLYNTKHSFYNMTHLPLLNLQSVLKNASRLDQIKFEERITKDQVEVAHERF